MKVNKLLPVACLALATLFPDASLQAQEARTLFINMPDSLCPLLTKVNREDCVDFMDSKMKAQVNNRFGKPSEMTVLGTDYVRMQLSSLSTWQLKLLALNDTTRVVCEVSTACGPACDSDLRFYTTDWKPLPAARFISLPAMGDFLNRPDSTALYAYDDARRSADMLLMKANFAKEGTDLTLTLTTPAYMATETAEKLKPFLRRPLVYHWVDGKFIPSTR
ncbi:MAG: DUF3256 family protein [Mediterranea sp.]|jgi:hypothetical protein|nr:DUF3256 family protein [Mediterranea sp.]